MQGGFNKYVYAILNPITFVDPRGLAVELCERVVDVSSIPSGVADYLPRHNWLKTSSIESGMGGNCPVPGQGCADDKYDKVFTKDHTGQSTQPKASCKEIDGVDEQCVNAELKPGRDLGRWHPLNQCQTLAQSVINKCSPKNRPFIGYPKP